MASKKILIQVDVTTKSAEVQINKVVGQINKLEGATAKLSDTTKKSRAQSGLNNAILIESGRFASDLRFGFTAVANNLGRIIELGQEFSRTEGGGLIPALKRIISFQGLFLIGFQLLVAYGDKVFAFLRSLVSEVDVTSNVFAEASKNISDLSNNFELYIAILQDSNQSEKEKKEAIKRLNEEYPDYIKQIKQANVNIQDIIDNTEEAAKQNDIYRQSILDVTMSLAAQDKIVEINKKIQEELLELRKIQREEGYETDEQAQQRIEQIGLEIEEQRRLKKEYVDTLPVFGERTSKQLEETDLFEQRIFLLKEERKTLEGNQRGFFGLGKTIQQRIEKLKEERSLYLDFIKISEKIGKEGLAGDEEGQLRERVQSFAEYTRGEYDVLFNFLFDKEEDYRFFLNNFKDLSIEEARILFDTLQLMGKDTKNKLKELGKDAAEEQEKQTKAQQLELQAREIMQERYFSTLRNLSKGLKELGAFDDAFKIASIITEKAESIGKVVMATRKSNTIIRAAGLSRAMLGDTTAMATAQKRILINNIGSGIDIAAIVAQAAGSIQAIRSKTSVSKTLGGGAGSIGGGVEVEAPDFNVVGIGGVSQVGQVIGAQFGQPLRAYVVSSDVRTGQALERNITGNAKLG